MIEYNKFEKKLKNKETIIVLDTNVLLDLLRYSLPTSKNILEIFSQCSDLLWIPNRVFVEYDENKYKVYSNLKNRYTEFEKKLKDIIDKRKEVKEILKVPERYNYSGIEDLKNNILLKLEEAIDEIKSYKETIAGEYIATSWYHNEIKQDIEKFICGLKRKNQVGCEIGEKEENEIINEGELRFSDKIPPGFKDEKKEGIKKYGDLFVWKEILKLPSVKKVKNVIFITNDEKDDWWSKDKTGKLLNLRSELYEEFKYINPEVSINFMTIKIFQSYASKLYNLYEPYVYKDFNIDEDFYINRINDKIKDEIQIELYSNSENYLGYGIEIMDVEYCKFIKIKNTCVVILPKNDDANYGIGIGINYELEYQLVLNCNSDYCFEEDEYTFMGTVVVSINRLIEKSEAENNPKYFNEDEEYFEFEIIENNIEQFG